MKNSIIVIIILFLSLRAYSFEKWNSNFISGLGITDNANFSSEDPESDLFAKLLAKLNVSLSPRFDYQIKLKHQNYFEQNQNDLWGWDVGLKYKQKTSRDESSFFNITVYNLNYLEGGDETHDQMGYFGLRLEWNRFYMRDDMSYYFMIKNSNQIYQEMDDRFDVDMLLQLGIDFEQFENIVYNLELDLNYRKSSDEDYTMSTQSFIVEMNWNHQKKYDFISGVQFDRSYYPFRYSDSDNSTWTLVQVFYAGMKYNLSRNYDLSFGYSRSNNTSNESLFVYTEQKIFVGLQMNY